jgi:SAM domain (Sterile alpha motif)
MDIVVWLRSLGLGKYEAIFRENDIDETVLPSLTAEDLKELGVVSLGHRRKLLDAIAAIRSDGKRSGAFQRPEDRAERRQVTVIMASAWTPARCQRRRRDGAIAHPVRQQSGQVAAA